MKRLVLAMLVLCLALCACAEQAEVPTTETIAPTTAPVTEPTTEPTTAPTTQPLPQFRHPLTGLPVEEPVTSRIFAVVTNNSSSAMPQHGTSQADILIEILAEGGVTRNLALYSDVTAVPALGAIRSARTYFQSLSRAFDAILVHSGDSIYANEQFKTGRYPNVDGMYTTIFYRDQDRLNAGYLTEHTLFIKGQTLYDYAKGLYRVTTERTDYGLRFNEALQMKGSSAKSLRVAFYAHGKDTKLYYDADKNAYSMNQYNWDYVDGNTGEKVYFSNVLVLYANMRTVETSHVFHTLEGSNIGFFATGGFVQPISWSRASEDQPFTLTYPDGAPVELTPGTTYIAVVHPGSVVSYE